MTNAEEYEMKPCPRCGSFATESLDAGPGYFRGYQVNCFNEFSGLRPEGCENAGPVKPTSAEAIAAWNAQP